MSSNSEKSFKTHLNYLRAFSHLVDDPPAGFRQQRSQECLARRIRASGAIKAPRVAAINLDQVQSSIQAAWGTETLLHATERYANEEEILRISNNWSAVQTYYIFYHCAQALHGARGQPRPESHTKTQNIFVDQWAKRSLMLPPWSLAYGCEGAVNTPKGIQIYTEIHNWSRCDGNNAWNIAAKSLMTTRREALQESKKQRRKRKLSERKKVWREEENTRLAQGRKARAEPKFPLPQLSHGERAIADREMRVYTIMDYLYRLRIRTNYEDSNMFTDGPEEELDSCLVRSSLCSIAYGTLLLYEMVIRPIVGADVFDLWVANWVDRNLPDQHVGGLVDRIRFHKS